MGYQSVYLEGILLILNKQLSDRRPQLRIIVQF
jgi:hypothetical protein